MKYTYLLGFSAKISVDCKALHVLIEALQLRSALRNNVFYCQYSNTADSENAILLLNSVLIFLVTYFIILTCFILYLIQTNKM